MVDRKLINKRTGLAVVDRLEIAQNPFSRMRGLLGRRSIDPGEGLLITACSSIHMLFMQFPIDVVYLDRNLNVLALRQNLGKFRLDSGPKGTYQTLELKAFRLNDIDIKPGDLLEISMK